jgi:hypothetical protein
MRFCLIINLGVFNEYASYCRTKKERDILDFRGYGLFLTSKRAKTTKPITIATSMAATAGIKY